MPNTLKCRAKNPAHCRVHGNAFIAEEASDYLRKPHRYTPPADYLALNDFVESKLDAKFWKDEDTDPRGVRGLSREVMSGVYARKLKFTVDSYLPAAVRFYLWKKEKLEDVPAEDNLLDPDNKSEPYERALAGYIADAGIPVSPNYDTYSWSDNEMSDHIRKDCHIDVITEASEGSWDEFMDSYHGNETQHGLKAKARCACGLFRGQLRVEGNLTDIVRNVVNRSFKV